MTFSAAGKVFLIYVKSNLQPIKGAYIYFSYHVVTLFSSFKNEHEDVEKKQAFFTKCRKIFVGDFDLLPPPAKAPEKSTSSSMSAQLNVTTVITYQQRTKELCQVLPFRTKKSLLKHALKCLTPLNKQCVTQPDFISATVHFYSQIAKKHLFRLSALAVRFIKTINKVRLSLAIFHLTAGTLV